MSQGVNKNRASYTPLKLVMLILRVHTTGPNPNKMSKKHYIRQPLVSFEGDVRNSSMAISKRTNHRWNVTLREDH